MNKELLPKILIAISLVLLGLNIARLDFDNLAEASYYGIAANVLVIMAMLIMIKNFRRSQNDEG
jgi:uncharacterized BrkB/YihY/UPF0761 family membrane protein